MSAQQRTPRRAIVSRLLVSVLILLASFTGARAQAADLLGHDVSWPQCPSPDGYGLPMPPDSTQFVIVGLTKGLAFTRNPCLANQVQWVTSRSRPAHAYGMATYPTAAQLTEYGSAGPWRSTTPAARLSNVGYAQAKDSVAYLAQVGWRPQVVWIDVEPRPAQPWPSGTAGRRALNRAVVEGFMRGLAESGYGYGLYSYTNGWSEIVGDWKLPNVPVWATAGRLDYANEAIDRCSQASFSGGRVLISQWYDDTRDYNRTCGAYQFTNFPAALPPRTGFLNDLNGDWRNDLLARTTDGKLWRYAGNDRGQFTRQQIGTSWGVMNLIEVVGDGNGDGSSDFIARDGSGGLYLYVGYGYAGPTRQQVGSGWNVMGDVAGVGDFNADGRTDLLSVQNSTGDLWLYKGDTFSGQTRTRVGTGWNVMDLLVSPGDFNSDGNPDLIAREKSTGYLWFYPGNGRGSLLARTRIGTGWGVMDMVEGFTDLNGDRVPDIVARQRSNGVMYLYPGNGTGSLQARVSITHPAGGTWSGLNALA
ncbi:VCBS repeat-containing protein [Tessaracoccus sp. MC1627]|uniref:FG-GAP-like repeat-containing protein n=1 Tax=Tessaracoccus sp. MC1627 TaxID=2760312 RepID=UPI00160313A0|nr:FG-GAP-like repeat-containing protein [Tessaracoccus sp. MC1627]MBB1511512.1 VCBS repeat-containing protein [Tessaracoccus sp. MC1627]